MRKRIRQRCSEVSHVRKASSLMYRNVNKQSLPEIRSCQGHKLGDTRGVTRINLIHQLLRGFMHVALDYTAVVNRRLGRIFRRQTTHPGIDGGYEDFWEGRCLCVQVSYTGMALSLYLLIFSWKYKSVNFSTNQQESKALVIIDLWKNAVLTSIINVKTLMWRLIKCVRIRQRYRKSSASDVDFDIRRDFFQFYFF